MRMSLDDRIRKDLAELYNGGATPGDITNALLLDGLVHAEKGQRSFATRALPSYYGGNRKARTIMVMLNPGCSVEKANQGLMNEIEKRSMTNANDLNKYHEYCVDYGHKDKDRQDNFDLKQAFFLHRWEDTGISLPNHLSHDSDSQTLLDAKEIVLTQKFALELIPYASRNISRFNPKKIHLLVPFVETLFDEIFSHDRKYVIFASRLFNDVFKVYNKTYPNTICFDRRVSFGKIGDSNICGTCNVITIHHNNKDMKAIIANTFPSQALPNAYSLMEMYGELCYKEYIK